MTETQQQLVIDQLRTYGEVSRNWCLRNYISRLGAIICTLQNEGWLFNGEYRQTDYGKDYVYTVVKKPELKLF